MAWEGLHKKVEFKRTLEGETTQSSDEEWHSVDPERVSATVHDRKELRMFETEEATGVAA